MPPPIPPLATRCLAEAGGTFVLIFLGCGAVHSAVLTDSLSGLWQVSIVWGVGVMLAVYVFGGVSGAHINPAITIALAAWGRFSRRDVPAYVAAQFIGAFLAAAVLFFIYRGFIAEKERTKRIVRGGPGSELTAMCYGEYFPNPGALAAADGPYDPRQHAAYNQHVGVVAAATAEIVGTLLLALVVFALTDERDQMLPSGLAPVFIGLTVAALVAMIAPLTQACLNPARDFGPRLFAAVAGWGGVAIPGPQGASILIVYLAAPIIGGLLGGGFYTRIMRNWHPAQTLAD
jgi:glycerol uptake facilitator protein